MNWENGMAENLLKHADLTEAIIGSFYDVYHELGHGFLESVYREALAIALTQKGLRIQSEKMVQVSFRGVVVGVFRTDLVVDDRVILELKTARAIDPAHEAQLLNYLKATVYEVGLVLNFGPRPQFRRLRLDNEYKVPAAETVAPQNEL
jgi:GxxExxY protein